RACRFGYGSAAAFSWASFGKVKTNERGIAADLWTRGSRRPAAASRRKRRRGHGAGPVPRRAACHAAAQGREPTACQGGHQTSHRRHQECRYPASTEAVVMKAVRNRIKGHRRVRAGDLVPHELNPRLHTEAQRAALAALYEEIGFARSLLAYELPDGRLKLIDGHLRQDLGPDMEGAVEVLDVNEAQARVVPLS